MWRTVNPRSCPRGTPNTLYLGARCRGRFDSPGMSRTEKTTRHDRLLFLRVARETFLTWRIIRMYKRAPVEYLHRVLFTTDWTIRVAVAYRSNARVYIRTVIPFTVIIIFSRPHVWTSTPTLIVCLKILENNKTRYRIIRTVNRDYTRDTQT